MGDDDSVGDYGRRGSVNRCTNSPLLVVFKNIHSGLCILALLTVGQISVLGRTLELDYISR